MQATVLRVQVIAAPKKGNSKTVPRPPRPKKEILNRFLTLRRPGWQLGTAEACVCMHS